MTSWIPSSLAMASSIAVGSGRVFIWDQDSVSCFFLPITILAITFFCFLICQSKVSLANTGRDELMNATISLPKSRTASIFIRLSVLIIRSCEGGLSISDKSTMFGQKSTHLLGLRSGRYASILAMHSILNELHDICHFILEMCHLARADDIWLFCRKNISPSEPESSSAQSALSSPPFSNSGISAPTMTVVYPCPLIVLKTPCSGLSSFPQWTILIGSVFESVLELVILVRKLIFCDLKLDLLDSFSSKLRQPHPFSYLSSEESLLSEPDS